MTIHVPLLSHYKYAAKCLSLAAQALTESDFTSREELDNTLRQLATETDVSYRNFMLLCRLAITGVKVIEATT